VKPKSVGLGPAGVYLAIGLEAQLRKSILTFLFFFSLAHLFLLFFSPYFFSSISTPEQTRGLQPSPFSSISFFLSFCSAFLFFLSSLSKTESKRQGARLGCSGKEHGRGGGD
jgi:hypothetical protein